MSIEMENPQTVQEKLDAAGNLVEQMMLAHNIKDDAHFKEAHARAGELLFEVQRQLEAEGPEGPRELTISDSNSADGEPFEVPAFGEKTWEIEAEAYVPLATREDVAEISFTAGAETAYNAYGFSTGWKTRDGRDMPRWADLGERVQTAWEASVRQTIYMFLGIEHTPDEWAGWKRPE